MTDKSKEDNKPSYFKNAILGAIGASFAKDAPSELLGYHNVYHGTSKANAKSALKTGLDPRRGGSGGASSSVSDKNMSEVFKRRSAGKVHVTKEKNIARGFAGITGGNSGSNNVMLGFTDHVFGGKGRVLKAKVTDSHWRNMKIDTDVSPDNKNLASTTHHKIPSSQIHGSKDFKGISGVVNKNTLHRYYSSEAGRARAAKGALKGIGGAAALITAAKNIHSRATGGYKKGKEDTL